jgi:cytochrome c553
VKLITLALTVAALFAATAARAATPASPAFENTMAQRTQACTVCHGKEGRAGPDGYYPRIAGKPAGYLYNQLLNFRDGRRHYGLMTRMLEPLSDAYLLEMAQYFAALDAPYPPPAAQQPPPGADTLRRGRQLALQGDAARKLPACASCHGAALTGVQPATPGLLGLPRDYLNAQLGAWRAGQRRAHAPDCMADVARRMDLADVNAVAAWLATQPVPANSKPVASLPAPAPLRCGMAPPATATAAAPAPANDLATRGAYLARAGNCLACHTTQGGAPGAGGRGINTPFGTVYAGNITPDTRTGIGGWTSTISGRRCTTASPKTAAAVPRLSVHQLHPGHPRRRRRPARLPHEPAAGGRGPIRRMRCAGPTARRPRWPCGARCISAPAASRPTRAKAPNGTAAPTWCGAWAIAPRATPHAMPWAPPTTSWTWPAA